eukprot:m.14949 g.14949  ORF g.14949 m.14949 type:complete len:93 (+) comp6462_c0_seq1:739-1017(+)
MFHIVGVIGFLDLDGRAKHRLVSHSDKQRRSGKRGMVTDYRGTMAANKNITEQNHKQINKQCKHNDVSHDGFNKQAQHNKNVEKAVRQGHST